jgi:D-alanine transaminase
MESLASLNGEIMPVDQAKVPVWDRGFLFGDAVYEVIRLYQGRCWLEVEHFARLRRSLAEMDFPPVDVDGLADRVRRTIVASGIGDGTAYIHVTRGVAPRHHAFPVPPVAPTELIVIRPYDDGPTARARDRGVGIISQPDLRWKRCDVKSTNLLANVVANEAAHRLGCYEAVLVSADGYVTEATQSSLLWVRGGRIEGTPRGPGILPGITRQILQRLVDEVGIALVEIRATLEELKATDEVLLLGTTIEVLPVVTVDGHPIDGGTPGRVTRELQGAYRSTVERWLASGTT